MTDVSILVMVALSFVFQFSDATIGTRTAEEDFTWKYNGEVNIGESRVLCPIKIDHRNVKNMDFLHVLQILLLRSARNEKKVREKRSLHVSKLQEKSLKASLQASQAGVCICIKHTRRAAKIQVRERAQNCTVQHCSSSSFTTADLRLLRTF